MNSGAKHFVRGFMATFFLVLFFKTYSLRIRVDHFPQLLKKSDYILNFEITGCTPYVFCKVYNPFYIRIITRYIIQLLLIRYKVKQNVVDS